MAAGQSYCDVVMKGGITSGIVYPNAVLALARKYRFKSIGGTSAGAIAAAAAAAAALGERRKELEPGWTAPPDAGFAGLEQIAGKLRTQGFIRSLFQPAPGGEAIYRLVLTLTRKPGLPAMFRALAAAGLALAPVTALISAVALLGGAWLIGGWRGMLAAAVPALVCVALLTAARALFRAAGVLRDNQLGLCSGSTTAQDGTPGLTDWLHTVLQSLAGKTNLPLTFSDLWEAPRYPGEPPTRNALQLAMITTGVSHHEPRTLPFEKSRFWYREDEFRRLFPKAVVDAIADRAPLAIDGKTYHRLPRGGAMPVLIATRMSLSFPLLISAVPLYEPDYRAMAKARDEDIGGAGEAAPGDGRLLTATEELATGGDPAEDRPTVMRVCWFSDGGIASNFPIHLFDAALPRWPTFAIDLSYPKSNDGPTDPVFLPRENKQGWQRVYSAFAGKGAFGEISGFLFAIVATMQNWRDLLQSRAPGHRDRIVHIALAADEGGMNLDMPQEVLERIADKGTLAGTALVEEFRFANHWWIRWRNVASGLERFLGEFAVGAGDPLTPDYADAHRSAATGEPDPPSYKFKAGQKDEAQRRFILLREEGEVWADRDPDLTEGAPNPLPHLRITPTF